MPQRLTNEQIRQRLAGLEEGETRTFHMRENKILYVRSEGGDPKLADFHAWIPNVDGKGTLWTYTGEINGLMALIAEHRKRPPRTKRPQGTKKP
jgi:hypothetical protein